jgi:hypothetical protein
MSEAIAKLQEKLKANTERIFKLQQQNMEIREKINKLKEG